MARKYGKKSIMDLDSSSTPFPMEVKSKVVGCTPTASDMVIDDDRDSLEGIDKDIRNSIKVVSNKRSY